MERPVFASRDTLPFHVSPNAGTRAATRALKEERISAAYPACENERHGLSEALTNMKRPSARFRFHSSVFGFEPADELESIHVESLSGQQGLMAPHE